MHVVDLSEMLVPLLIIVAYSLSFLVGDQVQLYGLLISMEANFVMSLTLPPSIEY